MKRADTWIPHGLSIHIDPMDNGYIVKLHNIGAGTKQELIVSELHTVRQVVKDYLGDW